MVSQIEQIRETLISDGLAVVKQSSGYLLLVKSWSKDSISKAISMCNDRSELKFLLESRSSINKFAKLDDELRERVDKIWRANKATEILLPLDLSLDDAEVIFCLAQTAEFQEFLNQLREAISVIFTPSINIPNDKMLEIPDIFDPQSLGRLIKFAKNEDLENRDKFDGVWRIVELRGDERVHPEDFVISRKRKLYKFAKFAEDQHCFDLKGWQEFYAKDFAKLSKHREIVVEIGAGSAIFLTRLAQQNPEKLFVAIDRKSDRLWQGAKLARESELENIFYLWTDVAKLTQAFAKNSITEIWLTFSDPYANAQYQIYRAKLAEFYHDFLRFPEAKTYHAQLEKYRHEVERFDEVTRNDFANYLSENSRSRLTDRRFLEIFAKLLVCGGELNFKTDNAPLFEWSLRNFRENGWRLERISRDVHREASSAFAEAKVMTSYEEKFSRELIPTSFAKLKTSSENSDIA